ncbi:Prostate-Specific Antigen [Manis pentadactyla]|nr:Prostate-Specific Antigen [Manis pentadactyla]
MLLRLAEPAQMTDAVRAADLPTQEPPLGSTCSASGWGSTVPDTCMPDSRGDRRNPASAERLSTPGGLRCTRREETAHPGARGAHVLLGEMDKQKNHRDTQMPGSCVCAENLGDVRVTGIRRVRVAVRGGGRWGASDEGTFRSSACQGAGRALLTQPQPEKTRSDAGKGTRR